MIEQELISIKILLVKVTKWTYKIKDFNVEKIIASCYEKQLLPNVLSMIYYPEPDSHIRDKIKVVLDLQQTYQT